MATVIRFAGPVLIGLVLAAFAVFAVRGLLDPAAASQRFGVGVTDASSELFYRVYLSRNLAIVVAGTAFLALRMWRALAVLTTAVLFLPVFDHLIVARAGAPVPSFHMLTLVTLLVVTAALWAKVRLER